MTINYPHAIFQFFEHLPKTWGYFFPQKLGKKAPQGPPQAQYLILLFIQKLGKSPPLPPLGACTLNSDPKDSCVQK